MLEAEVLNFSLFCVNLSSTETEEMKILFSLFVLIFLSHCKPKEDKIITEFAGKPAVPTSLKNTHAEILDHIHHLTLTKDSSVQVALKLEELMLHHFKEEENIILPPLGLLPALAKGEIPKESQDLPLFTDQLKTQMDHMSAEHQLIKAYIEELKQASKKENLPAISIFENEVSQHATSEEEIFFPASILVGEYLKLKAGEKL